MAKDQPRVCSYSWGTCPVLTIDPTKKQEPHRCGEYIFPDLEHIHICMGCNAIK